MTNINSILFSGAKNSTIARELNLAGFRFLVFGHDTIEKGIYTCATSEHVPGEWDHGRQYDGKPSPLNHIDEDDFEDFWYFKNVKASDIPTLKDYYNSFKKPLFVPDAVLTGRKQNRHAEVNFPGKSHRETDEVFEVLNRLDGVHFRMDSNSIFIDLAENDVEECDNGVFIK